MRRWASSPAIESRRPIPATGRTSRLRCGTPADPGSTGRFGGVLHDHSIEETLPKGPGVTRLLSRRTIDPAVPATD
jgi:hypothetical protein